MANSKNKLSTDFLSQFQYRLSRHVRPGQSVRVALSGGVDSVTLLHAVAASSNLVKLGSLDVFHVHHGLSANADRWETFCRQLCNQLGIRYESCRVEVHSQGQGIEAAARKARYAALENCDCDWILLGHHRDDQVETMMFNLLRGAGIHGAAGMAEVRGRLLRPLLDFSREQIEAYARHNGLTWVEDESNSDSRYSRNFLRGEIISLLQQKFPQAAGNLARAARAFADAADLLDQRANEDLGAARLLHVDRLRTLPTLRAENLLAYYLRLHGLQIPGSAMLRELLRQLLTAVCDSQIRFVIGDREVRRFRDQVMVDVSSQPVYTITWSGQETISWGAHQIRSRAVQGEGISVSVLAADGLIFAPRGGGDVLQLREDGPRRHLKDLLREAGIPPWRRKTLPVLYAGDEVVWVAGIGIAYKYRCKPGAEGILIEFDGLTW